MKPSTWLIMAVIGLAMLGGGCKSKELTRDKARALILQTVPPKKEWLISSEIFAAGQKAGLWTAECDFPEPPQKKSPWLELKSGDAQQGCRLEGEKGNLVCGDKTFALKVYQTMSVDEPTTGPVKRLFMSPKSPSGRWMLLDICLSEEKESCGTNLAVADLTTGAYHPLMMARMHGQELHHWANWGPADRYVVIFQYEMDEGEYFPAFYRVNLPEKTVPPPTISEIVETPRSSSLVPLRVFLSTATPVPGSEAFSVLAQGWDPKQAGKVMLRLDPKALTYRKTCSQRALTDLGKKYVVRVEQNADGEGATAPGGFNWNQFGATIAGQPYNQWGKAVLVNPVELDLEITGITTPPIGEAQTTKVVEFTWRFKDLPEPIAAAMASVLGGTRVMGPNAGTVPGKGEAEMQLYDDGWRIQHIQGIRYVPGKDESFQLAG